MAIEIYGPYNMGYLVNFSQTKEEEIFPLQFLYIDDDRKTYNDQKGEKNKKHMEQMLTGN